MSSDFVTYQLKFSKIPAAKVRHHRSEVSPRKLQNFKVEYLCVYVR